MKSFSEFIIEQNKKALTVTFGRFNPPTVGHEKLLDKVAKVAGSDDYRIYASSSQDAKKNPLSYSEKIKFMRKMFPRHARNIIDDSSVKMIFNVCINAYNDGYTDLKVVVGSDRVREFNVLLNKYNGKEMRNGFYNFRGGVQIVSAGERDPEADNVSGMSASKLRAAASANDLELFARGMPKKFSETEKLFNAVRKGMGLKESKSYRKHIKLATVSERREAYVAGDIFNIGDIVVISKTEQLAEIKKHGPNYVIVEHDGKEYRKWLDDIEPLFEEDGEFTKADHSLEIPRDQMPQISIEQIPDLLEYFRAQGAESEIVKMNPKQLLPTQKEFSHDKVENSIKYQEENPDDSLFIIASLDGHILDGHHRWKAACERGEEDIEIIRVKMSIVNMLKHARFFLETVE